jgi:hypothetical protein
MQDAIWNPSIALKRWSPKAYWLRTDPSFDPMRNDPRFTAIVKKWDYSTTELRSEILIWPHRKDAPRRNGEAFVPAKYAAGASRKNPYP